MIVIIDYDTGNLKSILNMIRKVSDKEAVISSHIKDIEKADKLILPGVGAFDSGMKKLEELKLVDVLNEKVLNERVPILGICLGVQLFTNSSEEGHLNGFGWIDASVRKFNFGSNINRLKVPHMGWTDVSLAKESKSFGDMAEDPRFYFVHSYHLVCEREEDILLSSDYGYQFTAAIEKENILGVQFHPEKSHKFGMKLFHNFIEFY